MSPRLAALCLAAALAGCGSATLVAPPGDAPVVTDVTDVTAADAAVDAVATGDAALPRFSFFVTSLAALQALSGSPNGFGGDLRYGQTGPGAGLRGADRICAAIAERSMPGASQKQWRAFLSATNGGDGQPVHAIDRIGNGPWYDRLGRLLANGRADLVNTRPLNADPVIANDFPNEDGIPNHRPDPTMGQVDNHDMLTGSDAFGRLWSNTATCLDWTSARGDVASEGRPRVGHSWPRSGTPVGPMGDGGFRPPMMGDGGFRPPMMGDGGFRPPMMGDGGFPPMMGDGGFPPPPPIDGDAGGAQPGRGGSTDHWISALDEAGCAPGVSLVEMGPPILSMPTVGSGGGYGGFYCFALTP